MLKLGIIGAGTVGTALAVRLKSKGYAIAAVASRSQASVERFTRYIGSSNIICSGQGVADRAELVFITTPDDIIEPVTKQIQWHVGQSVVHCSGADSVDILESATQSGAHVGGFHPLQTFASIDYAIDNLPGSAFALEAEEPLLSTLKEMVAVLDGYGIKLETKDKVLYHAAAVISCNYLVTLLKLATDLWEQFGVSRPDAVRALLPLLRGTVGNIANVGLPDCLTGPIARGDVGTIKKHLGSLAQSAPALLPIYQQLGWETIPIALEKGRLDKDKAEEICQLLQK